jgi:DNA end-binding protein Ku
MPARSIATASVSFGLVSIPVKLYPATDPRSSVSFNLLDKETGSRLKQQYVRATDGELVSRDNMVKGYEFAKGQFVTFTTEELKSLEERASNAIEIQEFVPLAQVDPVFFDKPYYLGPERGGEKAYRLLGEVMKETGRCAIARYAARGKQYLVLLRPADKGLVMQQLLYKDEVRAISEIPIPDVEVKMGELQLARQLVEQIAVQTFDAGKYRDEVRDRILADIQRKVEGHEIEVAKEEAAPAQIIDLMEALKASLEAQKAGGATRSAGPDARRPARRAETDESEVEDAAPARASSHKGAGGRGKKK